MHLRQLPSSLLAGLLLSSTVSPTYAQVKKDDFGAPSSVAAAASSLVFLLGAPGNCLAQYTDLAADSPSHNMAALWIRAAFHDAGTYSTADLLTAPSGADGSLINEFGILDNAGIAESIASRFRMPLNVNLSAADLIALGGAVSLRHCGGPTVEFRSGRRDVPANVTDPPSRIPLADDSLDTVKAKFTRMGLSMVDLVTLTTGSHTMGGVHGAISPTVTNETFVQFDNTPGVFDNDIFKQTLAGNCALKIDCAIANDPEMRPYVETYAKDQDAFFRQYSISFAKLISLTHSPLNPPTTWQDSVPIHQNLLQEGTVVVYNLPGVTYYNGTNGNNGTNSTNGTKVGKSAGEKVGARCPWAKAVGAAVGIGMGAVFGAL